MKNIRLRYLSGPNVYHNRPVAVMTLDLENLADICSTESTGFTDRIIDLLPGLKTHHCSPGHEGGFVERLVRGTYFAHIVEHVALELSGYAGIGVGYGKSLYAGKPGLYNVVVRSKSEAGMAEILTVAVDLAQAVYNSQPFPLEERIAGAKRTISRTKLGPSTQAIVDAAVNAGIPVRRLNDRSLLQLGYAKHAVRIEAALTGRTSAIAVSCAKNKTLTKKLLADSFIPVPSGVEVRSLEQALAKLSATTGGLVVKPADANHGRGVSLNVLTPSDMSAAFTAAQNHSPSVIVEEMFDGFDYRVLVVGGKMAAAALRTPAHVAGDGTSSIQELVERENARPERGVGHENSLTRIDLGEDAVQFLAKQNLDLSSVPPARQIVYLAATANLSTGGSATDVTDQVHPDIRIVCERAARILDLDICGIDLMTRDISQPLQKGRNGIIEVNAGPGLRMHLDPTHGKRREVGQAIVAMLYPAGKASRIPIVSVTGTNGKTTVTRLISYIFNRAGFRVGTSTTGGIYVGGELATRGDTTGPDSARAVLSDPSVDLAVLETARGGIVRRGLGYDWSDVGVVTNIQADHIGQDGIASVEDIIRIKTLIPERVREGGTIVVNADDENVLLMMSNPRLEKIKREHVYFSLRATNVTIWQHVAAGGKAVFVQDGKIIESNMGTETQIAEVNEIPLTSGGAADFQVGNVLAAVAACRAQNVPLEVLREALRTFSPIQHNAGRGNIYKVGKGFAVVDYGHNPAAFRAISNMAARWPNRKLSAVVSLPGDRTDALLQESGKIIARTFDQVYLRQDKDTRGRVRGDSTQLLRSVIEREAPRTICHEIADELEAVETAVRTMAPGEVIFVFYDTDPTGVTEVLVRLGARPAAPDVLTEEVEPALLRINTAEPQSTGAMQ